MMAAPDAGMGGLPAHPEPPGEAELAPLLAAAGPQKVVERNAAVIDPEITPHDRLLTGARIIAGNQGADREVFANWQANRTEQTPPRSGTDPRQAKVLAAPDSLERGKALGSDAAATWLEATQPDPIDVARFDRAVKTGRAAELWDKMKAGALTDDAEAFALAERVATVGQILDNFDDDLSLGGGRVVDIGDRVRVHWDAEPAPGVLTALSLDSMPLDAFDGDTDTGIDTHVGDDIVVAAPVESQAMLRRAFPAATYGEGTPRWLTVQPAVVAGLLRAVESAGADPSANVAVHIGGHPGMAPYDSIAFTTSSLKRADRFRALGAVPLGRGMAAVPRFKRRPLMADDFVDAPTADKLLDETSWAIFDGIVSPPAPFWPIPVMSGGKEFTMIFGIGPDEAAEHTSGFAYVNDGIAVVNDYDGLEPYSDEPRWFELALADGETYHFPVSQDEALLTPERTQQPVDRWQIPVNESNRSQLDGLAAHLEMLEADDIAAYTTGQAGDGFVEAREVLWGDGHGNVAASRVAGNRSGPNVIPVWLRKADALPADSAVSPDLLDTAEAEGSAERIGDRWRIDGTGTVDVAQAVRQGHVLAQRYGYDNVEVLTDRGPLKLAR
jgi:hypothetical protein